MQVPHANFPEKTSFSATKFFLGSILSQKIRHTPDVFKLGFIVQGRCPCTPPRNFLKEVSWNFKNLKNILQNISF